MRPGLMKTLLSPRRAVAYLPLTLPGATALAYYRADTRVYSDAGTTPATNGGTVQQMNDLTGNGRHISLTGGSVILTTGTPTYITFDGTTSKMANAAIPLVAPLTVAAKLKLVNAGAAFGRVWRTVGSNAEVMYARDTVMTTSVGHFQTSTGASADLTFSPLDDFVAAPHGISIGYDNAIGADLTARTNASADSSPTAAGDLSTTGFQLGDAAAAFQLQELVIYTGLLSSGNTTALLAYFG